MPVEVPGTRALPHALLQAVEPVEVRLLGYERFPEQTAPQQGVAEAGDDAREALDELVADASRAGFDVDCELVGTADLSRSLARHARDGGCQAVLLPRPTKTIERLLIPVLAEDQANARLATLVYDLTEYRPMSIQLVAMAGDDDRARAGAVSRAMTARLVEAGVSRDAIESELVETDDIVEATAGACRGDELVLLNESQQPGRDRLFRVLGRVMEGEVGSPTLVVLLESEQGDSRTE